MRSRWGFVTLLAALVACAGSERPAVQGGAGTLVISTAGDPDILLPPLVSSVQGRQVTDLVYDRLASLGDSLNTVGDGGFIPQLARSWTWSADSLSIAFHLDPAAKWHDGQPVTSRDVRFTFDTNRDPRLASRFAADMTGIDSVTAPDSATAVFWFHARTPEQFYDATDQMSILPEHLWSSIAPDKWRTSRLANAPIGSGQFRFQSWDEGASLTLVADTGNYRGRPKLDRVVWSIASDFNTALTRFLGGQTDFFEALHLENLPSVAKHPALRVVTFPGTEYTYLGFNVRDPANPSRPHRIFGDRAVRRALTMAVDRASIVKSVYDTLAVPALGPFLRAFPTTDSAAIAGIPFDLESAKSSLDSLGWRDTDNDGYREKNGKPLAFSILVPSSSSGRERMAVLLQEQLRRAGARVGIESLEFPTFIDRGETRKFDAMMMSLHSNPSPSGIREDWSGPAAESGGNNIGSYRSADFDSPADSAVAARDFASRRRLFSRAYQVIVADAPAIWLAEARGTVGVHKRVRIVGLRPDSWWQHLAEWWIPADERIARDLAPAARPVDSAPLAADSSRKAP